MKKRETNSPINQRYAGYTHEQYCNDYIGFLDKHKLLDQLQALHVTVNDEGLFVGGKYGILFVVN